MNKITKNDPQTQTQDIVNENISKLRELFPEVFTEGKIDFETLESLLGDYIEKEDERYNFTWKGKAEARRIAQTPSTATLRPAKEESKNWNTTENLYIEGDNLEVLKLLQKSYHKKVKMIYIDPPYNTGKDFVYKDNYKDNLKNYMELTGQVDEEGNKISTNSDSSGRYHSNWLNMMYPRLKLARNLLKDDGVIFISIDENEVHNLRKICDEVFGEDNFVDTLKWKRKKQPSFLAKHTAKIMEYIIIYAHSLENLEKLSIEKTSDNTKKVINIANKISLMNFKTGVRVKLGGKGFIPAGKYKIKTMTVEYLNDINYENGKTTNEVNVKARFSCTQENLYEYIEKELLFITSNKGLRRDLSEEEKEKRKSITDLLLKEWGDNQESEKDIKNLFEENVFEYTKPVILVENLIKTNYTEDSIILDFFSGSGTTAEAVFKLNSIDNGQRKFILVQLPEKIDPSLATNENSRKIAQNAINILNNLHKEHLITEIGKERIRRAGEKIIKDYELEIINDEKKENNYKLGIMNDGLKGKEDIHNSSSIIHNLDVGFKVFKLDSSNIKTWDATAENIEQKLLDSVHNIKSERSEDDVLFEVLLKYGLDLTLPIEEIKVERNNNHCSVYSVGYGSLVVCLDDEIDMEVAKRIVAIKDDKKPETMNVIFKDTGFKDDVAKTNVVQYLEKYEVDSIRSI